METRSWTWLARNVRQVWDGGVCRFGSSRETVRSATSMPSFTSSPWMRGAPHKGFAAAIREIRALIAALTGGRPTGGRPESLVQCARKRRRCHRRTVSGATITRAALHPVQTLASQTHRRRSVRRSLGRVTVLLYTASWWRKARFSRANCRWPPQRNGKSRSRWSSVVIMERDSRRVRGEDQSLWPPDGVSAKDNGVDGPRNRGRRRTPTRSARANGQGRQVAPTASARGRVTRSGQRNGAGELRRQV